jgi:Tol biopolymer transport system component
MQQLRTPRRAVLFTLAAIALFLPAAVRPATNPRLNWKTISTEHFDVHFHEGAEWTGEQVAKIAEEIYGPITRVYNYEPKRCHFIILDTEDYANGAAYYYDTKVEIWATNLEFNLRGTTQWLRNVVTHEYTHIVSIQASMKMPLRLPAIYVQGVGFEDEKRPDVINGYPDVVISYPIAGAAVPAWWAEGVSQYQSPSLQTDCWDTHRDMILRAAVLEDRMLTYDEMGFLGHRSLGNEQVYDHGFGLVRYIASTYGPEALDNVSRRLGDWYRISMDGALENVTGKSGQQLYDDWKASLKARYDRQLVPVYANPREGSVLYAGGFMTLAPVFSPDGKTVALLSNKGSDYSATALYTIDRDGSNLKQVTGGVSSRPVFSRDGRRLAYAKHEKADIYGARRSDLFLYDLATKKETRVTHALRASDPQFSPDGSRLVCVINGDGTHRLATMDADGKNYRVILAGEKGTQYYTPQFSPDGTRILFGTFTAGTRELASVAVDGSDFRWELRTPNDERDARYTADGTGIVFASDRSGIFNIYRMDLATRGVTQLTNVFGGAFMPDLAAGDGALVYAQYTGEGYRVARVDAADAGVAAMSGDDYAMRTAGEFDECATLKGTPATMGGAAPEGNAQLASLSSDASPDVAQAAAVDSTGVAPDTAAPANAGFATSAAPVDAQTGTSPAVPGAAPLEAKPYKWDYTGFQFYPRAVIWSGTPRLGLFATTNEIMDRQTLFFGGSYGVDGEFDAVINFELRRLFPVLFMQYFRVREKYEDQFPIEELGRYYYVDYRYDVWAADIGLRFEFEDPYSLTHRHELAVWWNHSEYKIHLDPEYAPLEDPDGARLPDQEVGWKYFNGNEAHLRWSFKSIRRMVDSDINPRGGRELNVEVMWANDDLFTSGEFDYGVNPDFDNNKFGQYTVDWREYVALPGWRHTLQIRAMASIIDKDVDDFFWVYMGGMDRLRGYTYYAIGGRKGAMASLTYRFPIMRRLNKQVGWLTFKDVYGALFAEAGNAWNDDFPGDSYNPDDYYKSVGGELRLNLGSFYNYPTTVNFTAAYALDEAIYVNPVFSDVPPVVYDPQWRWYLVMGFTF